MPGREDFQYAIVRVVPHVERGECLNAGVVLFCRRLGFLGARTALDEAALAALAPDCEADDVRAHLATLERVAAGDPDGGPIAALPAVRALPLADRAVEHDRAVFGGAHRPDERPGGRARAPLRASRAR